MSQEKTSASADDPKPLSLGEQLGNAMQAHATQILRECRQVDPHGNEIMAVPLAQVLIDLRALELKLQCLFEELGREQLVDPEKLMERTIRKFEHEARRLKQAIDSRPNLAIAQSIAGINGRSHG